MTEQLPERCPTSKKLCNNREEVRVSPGKSKGGYATLIGVFFFFGKYDFAHHLGLDWISTGQFE